jgi:hypothetical protein
MISNRVGIITETMACFSLYLPSGTKKRSARRRVDNGSQPQVAVKARCYCFLGMPLSIALDAASVSRLLRQSVTVANLKRPVISLTYAAPRLRVRNRARSRDHKIIGHKRLRVPRSDDKGLTPQGGPLD